MNTIAIFFTTIAATAAYSLGFAAIGSTFLAIGILAAAFADYGTRRATIR